VILITGFGPFLDVQDNPSARLARALHGRHLAGHAVEARVLPVTYDAVMRQVPELAAQLSPVAIFGFGVARRRPRPEVEERAVPLATRPDIEGHLPTPPPGPGARGPTLDPRRLAAHLGAGLSRDAGTYVCNAWLYYVPAAVTCPAAFVHIPEDGVDAAQIAAGLASYLAEEATHDLLA
jgi:pyroglutamyl-peptidase